LNNSINFIDTNGYLVIAIGSSIAAQFGFKISDSSALCFDDSGRIGTIDSVSLASGTDAGFAFNKLRKSPASKAEVLT